MDIYRSPMEKILKEEENNTVITNPNERGKTLLRKIAYRYAWWREQLNRIWGRIRSHP